MPATSETRSLLEQGRWFGGLPHELQERILEEATIRSYRRGHYVVREGARPRAMHAVLSGRVRVTRCVGPQRDEVLIYVGEPGFWFGDYAVFARANSIGSIVADSAVRTLSLSVAAFERIIEDEPAYYRLFAELLFERYAELFRYLGEAHGLTSADWLRTRLVDLARQMRRDNPAAEAGQIVASQVELARMMGLSRQTLVSLLRQLEAHGVIEVGFRRIRVKE